MPFDDKNGERPLFELGRLSKKKERAKLLRNNPELRIHIPTSQLKEIVDYIEFKCARDSSVARNEAIVNSDIDGGMVITHNYVPDEERIAFINALRSQGFHVADIAELHQAERELAEYRTLKGSSDFNNEVYDDLVFRAVGAKTSLIQFFTSQEIDNFVRHGFPSAGTKAVYYDGFSIQ